MTAASLRLVSFAAKSCTDDAWQKLRKFGYGVEVLTGDTWLAGQPDDSVNLTLLLFACDSLPRRDILKMLNSGGRAPSLAVVHRDKGSLVPEILSCCDEFLWWPCHEDELALRLRRLLPESPVRLEPDSAKVAEEFVELDMIGQSPRFLEALSLIKRMSRYDAPVLIQGATGTGKEMAARAIHYLGAGRQHPFTPLNCGAIPENLFENELFGHEKGAFTDASVAQQGLVAQADGGTLFLDEVDTLSPKAQVTLLRFLQDYEYKPLGGKRVYKATVRVIAAANSDLEESVDAGNFRQDLWFRLNVLWLNLPALADRPGDINLLAEYFFKKFSDHYDKSIQRFDPCALTWMNTYSWPGNVRELENLVHRAVLTSDGPVIDISHLMRGASTADTASNNRYTAMTAISFNDAKCKVIAEFEKQYLGRLMNEAQGNVTRAARIAGKERRALGKLLKKYGIVRAS